jgi:hypothetical protein
MFHVEHYPWQVRDRPHDSTTAATPQNVPRGTLPMAGSRQTPRLHHRRDPSECSTWNISDGRFRDRPHDSTTAATPQNVPRGTLPMAGSATDPTTPPPPRPLRMFHVEHSCFGLCPPRHPGSQPLQGGDPDRRFLRNLAPAARYLISSVNASRECSTWNIPRSPVPWLRATPSRSSRTPHGSATPAAILSP